MANRARTGAPVLRTFPVDETTARADCAARCVREPSCAAIQIKSGTCSLFSEYGTATSEYSSSISSAIRVEPSLVSAVASAPKTNPSATPYDLTIAARYLEPATKTKLTLSCPKWSAPLTQDVTAGNDGKVKGPLQKLAAGGVCTLSFAGNPDTFKVYLDVPVLKKGTMPAFSSHPAILGEGINPGDEVTLKRTCGATTSTSKKTADAQGKVAFDIFSAIAPGTSCTFTITSSGGLVSNAVTVSAPNPTAVTVQPGAVPMVPITK